MYAIAGAILINAACILMASGRDVSDVRIGTWALMGAGGHMLAGDLTERLRKGQKDTPTSTPKSP